MNAHLLHGGIPHDLAVGRTLWALRWDRGSASLAPPGTSPVPNTGGL